MRTKKAKIWLGLFIVMFTAFSSFEVAKEETPCYYFQMFWSQNLSDPAWAGFGEVWMCSTDLTPICAWNWNELYQNFDPCMRGVPVFVEEGVE
ncbi:hypothetical protein [Gynurincola endophyticus]|uniref:hypothetical protein n=1 Tax=Gynurincola endophyticus TaxID=2479004 RepID=UPI000F8D3348|nr:hypothetical protein [Gynurincola endophyticus]